MKGNKQGLGKAITAVAVIAGVALGGVVGGLVGYGIEPNVVTETVTVEVPVVETVTETVEVEVPVNVTVEKIVEVEDMDFKRIACDRLGYDILSECVEEVEQEDIALKNVINFIEEEFDDVTDFLEDEGMVEDEDDISLVRIYDDFEDVVVEESDFDDNEYEFTVKIKVDDDEADSKRYFYVTVSSNDGELEIENITE